MTLKNSLLFLHAPWIVKSQIDEQSYNALVHEGLDQSSD
jgi:hypothetical protein